MTKRPAKAVKRPTKYEYLDDLLKRYGLDMITKEQFWAGMDRYHFTQDHIDRWLVEYYRRWDNGELPEARRYQRPDAGRDYRR
jgi:hypothetical protein